MLQGRINNYGLIWSIIIILFTFQNPLEKAWFGFSYIDEVAAITSLVFIIVHLQYVKSLLKKKKILIVLLLFAIFISSGLAANVIYKYQPITAVAIDLFTNLKFYMSLATGYLLFPKISWSTLRKHACVIAKLLSAFLMCIFVMDRIFNLYDGGIRYGLRSTVLFYSHPTYLAGALVFLLALLSVTYRKSNTIYIAMDVTMLAFTLRSKALVGAALYMFLFWYILKYRKKLKAWQFACIAVMAILLAWHQIYFYYIALAGESARSALTLTSLNILKDFFPIGTGFATFASHMAAEYYSPVYTQYELTKIYGLEPQGHFLNDTFWPIIIGQTGALGIIVYVLVLIKLVHSCFRLKNINTSFYMGALFMMAYLFIASTAEPAFNNSIATPLAFLLGIIFRKAFVCTGTGSSQKSI